MGFTFYHSNKHFLSDEPLMDNPSTARHRQLSLWEAESSIVTHVKSVAAYFAYDFTIFGAFTVILGPHRTELDDVILWL